MVNQFLLVLLLTLSGLLGGCGSKETDSSVNEQVSKEDSDLPPLDRRYYKGFTKDLVDMRKTHKLSNSSIRASSAEAVEAASRISKRIDFVGMTKKEVLSLLGDPATLSDYGIAAGPGVNSPLKYLTDVGWGSSSFTLEFKDGKVHKVLQSDE